MTCAPIAKHAIDQLKKSEFTAVRDAMKTSKKTTMNSPTRAFLVGFVRTNCNACHRLIKEIGVQSCSRRNEDKRVNPSARVRNSDSKDVGDVLDAWNTGLTDNGLKEVLESVRYHFNNVWSPSAVRWSSSPGIPWNPLDHRR